MFDDIFPKRKFYDEMKEKIQKHKPAEELKKLKKLKKASADDHFDELMDMVKELTEEIEQADLDV